jgi:transcriptional regulator with XRE-family HTH domain
MATAASAARWSRKSLVGRKAEEVRRSIGGQIRQLREDAGLSQRQLAAAAGVPQSHLSEIERGIAEASITVLAALSNVLGADLSVRLFPTTGPRIHDRTQAAIVEALLREADPDWKRLVEVPVWRPVRGVIDLVLARPGEVVVSTEVHSEIRRLEQQIRWGREKAEALPSAEAWSMLSSGRPATAISQLLVLRNTRANRQVARTYEATLKAAYPANTSEALGAIRDANLAWPGAALIWAIVTDGAAQILDGPPRGVALGR